MGELCDRGLASIQTGPFGSQLHASDYEADGIPVIPTEAIGRRRLCADVCPRISRVTAERLHRHTVRAGDILFARRGVQATGFSALVEPPHDGWICGTGAILLRVQDRQIDPAFVSFFLSTDDTIDWLKAHAAGAVMPNVNSEIVRRLPLTLPPPGEQLAIAKALSALDDKIELNRQMNVTLEAMARALFKSWFVDFDPVTAKAASRDSGLPRPLADLFPDRFENSEIGEIPAGWEVRKLGDVLELAYGKALKASHRRGGTVRVFGSNGQVGWHDERLAPGPGIVVGRKGNPGVVTWTPTDFFVIDTAFYVVPTANCRSLPFLFHVLRAHDLASLGAHSAVPGLNRTLAYLSTLVLPPRSILEEFDAYARSLAGRQHQANEESRTLAALRDTLLPKLLSGEIRVREAETLVERAGA